MSRGFPLDSMSADEARAALARCCGSRRWVEAMVTARPLGSLAGALAAAERVERELMAADWLEAFAHHPRLGDLDSLRTRFATTAAWAGQEQRGARDAPADVLAALAEGNRAYEARFGFIFILCASGLSAEEMLSALSARLTNEPEEELRVAAREQSSIARLRLQKWFSESHPDEESR